MINKVIREALETVTLADLIDPHFTRGASMQEIFKNSLSVTGTTDLPGLE